jgi:hypothetical protein
MQADQSVTDGGEQPLRHRLTGLQYPRHILDSDGEPLCGIELSDDHQFLLEKLDPEELKSLTEFLSEYGVDAVDGLCGNCRRSYRSTNDDEQLEQLIAAHVQRNTEGGEAA